MTGLELKAVEQAAEKSEGILKTLFKESFEEWGGMIADNVRLRRFKNQVKIFEKAKQYLKDKKIDPKKVSLKVLAPLLEFTSLEEEPTIQDMWANLTVNILEKDDDTMFQQNAIAVLNKLSVQDVELLNYLFNNFLEGRAIETKNEISFNHIKSYEYDNHPFNLWIIQEELDIYYEKLHFRISNLIGLNLLKWGIEIDTSLPTVKIHSKNIQPKSKFSNTYIDSESYFIFTPFGAKLMFTCTNQKQKS